MPLFEKARVEVYVPDLPTLPYQNLLDTLEQEFTYSFGGCTIVRSLHGSYLSEAGFPIVDRINVIYTDASLPFDLDLGLISRCFHIAALRLNRPALLVNRQRRQLVGLLEARLKQALAQNAALRERLARRDLYIGYLEERLEGPT